MGWLAVTEGVHIAPRKFLWLPGAGSPNLASKRVPGVPEKKESGKKLKEKRVLPGALWRGEYSLEGLAQVSQGAECA